LNFFLSSWKNSSFFLLIRYIKYKRPDTSFPEEFDILKWWRAHQADFPLLAQMARDYLAIPVSSASSERLFSACGNILTSHRQNLGSEKFSKMIFAQQNMEQLKHTIIKWETKRSDDQPELERMDSQASTASTESLYIVDPEAFEDEDWTDDESVVSTGVISVHDSEDEPEITESSKITNFYPQKR